MISINSIQVPHGSVGTRKNELYFAPHQVEVLNLRKDLLIPKAQFLAVESIESTNLLTHHVSRFKLRIRVFWLSPDFGNGVSLFSPSSRRAQRAPSFERAGVRGERHMVQIFPLTPSRITFHVSRLTTPPQPPSPSDAPAFAVESKAIGN